MNAEVVRGERHKIVKDRFGRYYVVPVSLAKKFNGLESQSGESEAAHVEFLEIFKPMRTSELEGLTFLSPKRY